jgi:putative transposase
LEKAPYKSVFLDPGVRTFQTFYSPDGICGKIGDQYCNDFIKPKTQLIDNYESIRSKSTNWRTRRNIRNRLFKLRNKIRNKIQDLHWKTCKFLCDGFDTIFLPEFKSSEMVINTPNRIISKKTVRQMLELSHCEFRNKLIYYAKTKHRELVIVSEEYTTKTCGKCGIQNNIGSDKIYSCSCGYTMDRDIHGARNICIKILS